MSFKVICIKNGPWINIATQKVNPIGPKYGDECTVVKESLFSDGSGKKCFILAEYPTQTGGYGARHFIPLDGPDERERLEAWQEKQADEYDRQFAEILESMPDAI